MLRAKRIAHFVFYKVQRGEDLNGVLASVEAYLDKVHRLDLYPLVLGYAKLIFAREASRNAVRIISSHEIDPATEKEITATLTDESVRHETETVQEMIGGFEAEYKDRKIGINLKANIEQFTKHLTL